MLVYQETSMYVVVRDGLTVRENLPVRPVVRVVNVDQDDAPARR